MLKIKLLIIDDDTKVLKLMQNVLEKEKYNIFTLTDADNIVNNLKKIKPDIVLLDIKLPRVSGAEAIHFIKADKFINQIPIIAFTSYSMKGDKEKFIKMGYDGYISKPINTRTISQQIIENLKK